MQYGIFKHGQIKTFLTRGILKKIFQPLMYSSQDRLHYTFVKCLDFQLRKLFTTVEEKYLERTAHWLVRIPDHFFELLFLSDKNSQSKLPIPIFKGNVENNGNECAFITQAFVLSELEQILKNDKEFKEVFGLSIEHFEILTYDSLIGHNSIVKYLNRYRKVFSSTKLDPREAFIIYAWDICDALIPDREKCMKVMGCWDDDILAKSEIISIAVNFFVAAKEDTLEILRKNK